MSVAASVQHDTVVTAHALVYGVNQLAFDVRLEVVKLYTTSILLSQCGCILLKCCSAVNLHVASALQVEVWAIQNKYLFHWEYR